MNIQTNNFNLNDLFKPNTFVEATVMMAQCYKNALDAAMLEDDLTVRKWVDASRSLKKFIGNYKNADQKDLIKDLEKSGSKETLSDALQSLKGAEVFVEAWASRFQQLSLESYGDFQPVHWDMFLDHIVPLSWSWETDLFVLLNKDETILEKLIQRGHHRFIVVEPDLKKCKILIKIIKKAGLKEAHVVKFTSDISNVISSWITNPPQTSRVITTTDPNTDEETTGEFDKIEDIVREGMLNALTMDTTIKKHDLTWIQNGLGNFSDLANNPHANCLNGKFSGYSAVVVSPGPSLEKNIDLLKEIKGRAIIIAGSHSLQYLRDRNIIPHVILHVDPSISIEDYFHDFELEKVELLVLCATTDPALFKLPVKRKAWIYANAYFDNWLMKLLSYDDFSLYGSCVSVAALKLAFMWGCSEVTLVGQDLSFEDGKYYAGNIEAPAGVMESFTRTEKAPIYYLPGYYGGEVLTKNDYRMYHKQFKDIAKDVSKIKKLKCYNSTEGGANIEGFKNIPLADFINKNLSRKSNKNWSKSNLDEILNTQIDKAKVKGNLIKVKRHLVETEKLLLAAIQKLGTNSGTLSNLQKKISRKLKNSLLLKMALQDELEKIKAREDYRDGVEGYKDRGQDMYDACLKVVRLLKLELSKLKF